MRHGVHIAALLACSLIAFDVLADDAGPAAPPALPADRMPTVRLTVEPLEAAIGDPIAWRAVVRRRVGDRVHLPSSADFGGLEVQTRDREVSDPEGDWLEETLSVTLIAFAVDEHEIPPQKLTVVDIEGRIAEIETEAATVTIKSLIANEPEPRLKPDLGPGERVFEKDYTALYVLAVLAGIAAIALLTLLGRWLWSKRRPRPGPPPPPPRPAEEIALEKLELLRSGDQLDQGQHKEFHVLLSETVREYVGNRYGFDSLELSTEEMTAHLRTLRLSQPVFDALTDLLDETDLVKFAKYVPAVDESRRLLDEAFRVVEITTPKKANEHGPPSEAPAGSEGGPSTNDSKRGADG
jgi:hypothetical protein